jgi:hypothetical protein
LIGISSRDHVEGLAVWVNQSSPTSSIQVGRIR